jgi:putative component of membrane protein insertase Oxa1/YidC/SpoIIIJ protein YidD
MCHQLQTRFRSFVLFLLVPACLVALAATDVEAAHADELERNLEPAGLAGDAPPYPFHRLFSLSVIRGYQWLLSDTRGASCPMHPHCSAFGQQAFAETGFLPAVAMTGDRLLRCGNDLDNYDLVRVGQVRRFSDPVPQQRGGSTDDEPWWNAPVHRLLAQSGSRPNNAKSSSRPPSMRTDDSLQLSFANWLQGRGEFDRAITEYQRLIFGAPYSRWGERAADDLMACFHESGRYTEAFDLGISLLAQDLDSNRQDRVLLSVGKSSIRRGDYGGARFHLVKVSPEVLDQSFMLEGVSYAFESRWEEGARAFAEVGQGSSYANNAIACERLCAEGTQLKLKNPTKAGVLAVIPGLGYLYDGYERTALSAFAVNTLFIWGTYEAFHHDNPGLGTVLAFFGAGWYSGNIYGSVHSARRQNARSHARLMTNFNLGFQF